MTKQEELIRWSGLILVVLATLSLVWFQSIEKEKLLAEGQEYFVAKIINDYQPARGAKKYTYQYKIGDDVYQGITTKPKNVTIEVGDYFLIAIPKSKYPDGSIFLYEYKLKKYLESPSYGCQ